MSRTPRNPDDPIAAKAADFVLDGEEAQPADEQQLVGWLAESPQHVGEYMRMSALWETLADPSLDLDVRPVARPRRIHRAWWAAAAMIVLAIGAASWLTTRPETHHTALGEVTSFPLADRSVVFLNADSRLSVHYTDTQRRIVLHSGEAVFEVASDVERPFVVICGATRVTAVGTKFAVGRRAGETIVTLIEGRVVVAGELEIAQPAPVPETRLGTAATVTLTPGQQVTVRESGAATVATVDPLQVAPWRHRRLVFDSEPLAEVAAEFNRFNQPPLRIEGEALRDLRISGVFSANDPESLLAYLRTLDGIDVRIDADGGATVLPSR